ncbi:hypothetical protein HanRHA438_Chr06g0250931 [Helianthus annuus]|nr:hypothetical protein HanRHA438_Chr06g0250931 [Helianthus annuus]
MNYFCNLFMATRLLQSLFMHKIDVILVMDVIMVMDGVVVHLPATLILVVLTPVMVEVVATVGRLIANCVVLMVIMHRLVRVFIHMLLRLPPWMIL